MYGNGFEYYGTTMDAYNTTASAAGAAVAGALIVPLIISLALTALVIVSMWKLFKKAGKNGWEAIVPVYNIIVLLDIAGFPAWNILFFIIPIYQIIFMFKVYIAFAKKFGKDTGFGVCLAFFAPICLPILAFSKDVQYVGNVGPIPTTNETLNQAPAYVGPTPSDAATTTQINQGNFGTQPAPVAEAAVAATVAEPAQPATQSQGLDLQAGNFNGTVAGMPVSEYAKPAEPAVETATVVEQPVATSEPVTVDSEGAATKTCPTCGAQLDASASFCGSCGTQL